MTAEPHAHGNTPAAWTAVAIMLVGSLVAAVGFVIPNLPVIIVGAVVILLGLLVGKLMQMMGMGAPPASQPTTESAAESS